MCGWAVPVFLLLRWAHCSLTLFLFALWFSSFSTGSRQHGATRSFSSFRAGGYCCLGVVSRSVLRCRANFSCCRRHHQEKRKFCAVLASLLNTAACHLINSFFCSAICLSFFTNLGWLVSFLLWLLVFSFLSNYTKLQLLLLFSRCSFCLSLQQNYWYVWLLCLSSFFC